MWGGGERSSGSCRGWWSWGAYGFVEGGKEGADRLSWSDADTERPPADLVEVAKGLWKGDVEGDAH